MEACWISIVALAHLQFLLRDILPLATAVESALRQSCSKPCDSILYPQLKDRRLATDPKETIYHSGQQSMPCEK